MMGSPIGESGRSENEFLHKVRITRPFFISRFETTIHEWNMRFENSRKKEVPFSLPVEIENLISWVDKRTQKQKRTPRFEELVAGFKQTKERNNPKIVNILQLEACYEIIKRISLKQNFDTGIPNPHETNEVKSRFKSFLESKRNLPVTNVSYSQVISYCGLKTTWAHENGLLPKGLIYRLPTEAEWEYACRAGSKGFTGLGDGKILSGMNANVNGGKAGFVIGPESYFINRAKLFPVNPKTPKFDGNPWGIHDMHGSVMEWCYDFFAEYPRKELSIDPIGPIRGAKRVLRGGSYLRTAQESRSASRLSMEPSWRGSEIGFRLVLGYALR